ncbi:MAG: hypothetical protein ACLUD0_08810 [Eubacterium ramulus]
MAATCEVDEKSLRGHSCVGGIDFSKINDFAVAGILFKEGEKRFWIYHVWVCEKSRICQVSNIR